MISFAENEFWLDSAVPGSEGKTTNRKSLQNYSNQNAPGIDLTPLNRSRQGAGPLNYIWRLYSLELQWNSPLSFQELKAWSELKRFPVTAEEVEWLFLLDKLYRIHNIKENTPE